MSVTERLPYKFKMFSDDYFRLMNQAGVRQRIDLCDVGYNGCWDTRLSPDGILYYAPSDASGRGLHTRLVAYDYQTDKAEICFKAEDVVLPNPRQLPVTKLHESLSILPDGRIFATTHSTDRAPNHPEWMPFAHHAHIWEGWPGSTMVCYDPKTATVENWGIPAPRESIYGATYDAKHNAIYMIGFMRGHVYRYALDTHTVKDLGKAAEVFCYRLHVGPDRNIYGCTKSGYLWRVNVDTEQLEDLNWRVPEYPGNYCNNTWYRYMSQAHNVDDHTMIFSTFCSDEFFVLDTNTLTVRPLGYKTNFEAMVDRMPITMGVNEFAIDRYGVLWYVIALYHFQKPADDFSSYMLPDYLMRWDYANGKAPECLGVVGTIKHVHGQTSGVCIDRERDIMYMVDSGHPDALSVICVALEEFRSHMHEPGPGSEDQHFRPKPMTSQQIEAYKKRGKATEEVTASNPFHAFPIETVTPVRIWRHVPHTNIEDSRVIGLVWDENNVLHGLCGDTTRYCFTIRGKRLDAFMPFSEADEKYREWLLANIYPRSFSFDESVTLPGAVGRRYLAKASAVVDWNGGRTIVGTRDGLLAIVHGSEVFALGNAAAYGPVRCLFVNADKTRLWGTAGDEEDLGTVFYYDDRVGLRQLGLVIYNLHGYFDGPSASNILSSIAVSPDETLVAVGGADRMGAIHIAEL
jgi:sugar lactone lactonase YvrE